MEYITQEMSPGGEQMCYYDSRGITDQSEVNCRALKFPEQDVTWKTLKRKYDLAVRGEESLGDR